MNNEIILFHWNILEMPDGKAIFVGLRYRGERDIPSLIADSKDLLLNYSFRFSTPIKEFDEQLGHGITYSGRVYQCIGKPSDPQHLIRNTINRHFGRHFTYRYKFNEYDA
tara:strand:+ start:522 stop:851 length:330 start_codon:yes stop_codon:yes gene_type:complete